MSDRWYRRRDPGLDMLLALTDDPALTWHLRAAAVIGIIRSGYERDRAWLRVPLGHSWPALSTGPRDPGLCLRETGQLSPFEFLRLSDEWRIP